MSELKEITLTKDYEIRHDIIILKGSKIKVGPYRAYQLAQAGLVEDKIGGGVVTDHKKKSERVKKEDKPQIVEHKIKE